MGGRKADPPSPKFLVAAAVQLELLRQAAVRSGHSIVEACIVVIDENGSYSFVNGFAQGDVVPVVLAAYRMSVGLTTVSRSARVRNEFQSNRVSDRDLRALHESADLLDPWDEDEESQDLFDELFDPDSRADLFFELDDE